MTPPKRKRSATVPKPNKRAKHVPLSETEYSADCILDERIRDGVRKYLVKWTDVDPGNGQVYSPTWEPVQALNEALIASWEEEKAQRGTDSTSSQTGHGRTRGRPGKEKAWQRQNRNPRLVESSAESSTQHPSSLPSTPLTSARDDVVPGFPSSAVTTPIGTPASSNRPSPHVQVNRRGSSLERGEYDPYSQIPPSASEFAQLCTQETDLDSSQIFATAYPYSSNIVPDTQSSAGEASFAPATQQTGETNQQSTSTDEEDKEEVTEDSGFLEILQETTSRAVSPTRSIPETIADTAGTPQSQQQRIDNERLSEHPNTVTSTENSFQTARPLAENEGLDIDREEEQSPTAKTADEWQEIDPIPETAPQASNSFQPGSLQATVHVGIQREDEQTTPSEVQNSPSPPNGDSTTADTRFALNKSPKERQLPSSEEHSRTDQSIVTPSKEQIVSASCASQASLSEQSLLEQNAQFPFHSQQPIHSNTSSTPITEQITQQVQAEYSLQDIATAESIDDQFGRKQTNEASVQPTADSVIVPESSKSESSQVVQRESQVISQPRQQDDDLCSEFLVLEYARSPSPVLRKRQPIQEQTSDIVAQSIEAPEIVVGVISQGQASIPQSPEPCSDTHSTESREQNAQIASVEADLSTQENVTESIRPTIEEDFTIRHASSWSRHDSSQETPERQLKSTTHSSSPIPHPPSHSIDTFDSKKPSRLITPVPASSLSTMAGYDTAEQVAQELKERLAKKQAENPFTPTRRFIKSSLTSSSSASAPVVAPDPTSPPLTSARRLFRANVSPSAAIDGTRSPSIVPDRSPASQIPTSLRTVAFAPNSSESASLSIATDSSTHTDVHPEPTDVEAMVTAENAELSLDGPEATEHDHGELSDAEDENDSNESLLNDDLDLDREEYIVPLCIEGRQSDMYSGHIKQNKDLLEKFLKDPRSCHPLSEVDEILSHLRAIETHIDLVFAEAEPTSRAEANSATQVEFAAQFGMENSVKFRFLHWLFQHLQDHNKHVVLVTKKDYSPLFAILETFCRAKSIDYRMPTKNLGAEAANVKGQLIVTIFPVDESPVIQAPDLIICLDGVQEANRIRQKNWARSPDNDIVPILHLVIPRTVGHIERYISPALDARERLHTTLASLAQMRAELGRPIDEDTHRAPEAAELVANWVIANNDDEGLSWPLSSIGSVKGVIEYQTQMSQASNTPPAPERIKRPLDDEELDSAKRRRFTPQPQTVPSSDIANDEDDTTRIANSMPGTIDDEMSLRRQIAQLEEACQKERSRRKAEEQRFQEHEAMWDTQQTVHETLTRDHRLLLGAKKTLDEKLETLTKNNEILRERLSTKTAEHRQLTDQLEEQRATHLLSEDDKIAGITLLRKELAIAQEGMQRATKAAQTAESTLEYMKEQYRLAQDAATSAQSTIEKLTAEKTELMHAASGEPAKLKALHLGRQFEQKDKQLRAMSAELGNVKRALCVKEDELTRWKNNIGRAGVGTRAQSATPQPKVRSRAASPMGGRLSNLRNG